MHNRTPFFILYIMKKRLIVSGILLALCLQIITRPDVQTTAPSKDFIKWVDFNVSYEALCLSYELDTASHDSPHPLNWVELLSYAAAKAGGVWEKKSLTLINEAAKKLSSDEKTLEELIADLKYYPYYLEAYGAVLNGMVGEYEIEETGGWVKKYGLKAFSPVAKGFAYSDFDDFGVSRSYGFKREHLGHDMMGQVGTPIIAVESGYVECLGWNQYGGWRIGIRSFDKQRYYYYAHLRKNFPYCKSLEEGSIVTAGDVIGYMGRTGYSKTENTNNITQSHLHFGLQLIFDESQKESNNEIWIDCYALIRFLYKNRSETQKDPDTKEWFRVYEMRDPISISCNHMVLNDYNFFKKLPLTSTPSLTITKASGLWLYTIRRSWLISYLEMRT